MFALATEAAGLHWLSRTLLSRAVGAWAHFIYFIVGLTVLSRLFSTGNAETAVFNGTALSDFWTIVLAAGSSFLLKSSKERFVYRYVAHGAFLLWLWRELSQLTNGQGVVTVAWGVYAAALLVVGLRRDIGRVRTVGLVTLFLVVAKLFWVDLAAVKAIWRVLLFIGFGGGFLALSYYFQSLKKTKD